MKGLSSYAIWRLSPLENRFMSLLLHCRDDFGREAGFGRSSVCSEFDIGRRM
jgi:hypothetical protein